MAKTYVVSVMYPNQDGAKFDFDYYCSTHIKLVTQHLKPFGLKRTAVEKGLSGGAGQKAPYVCVGHLYFDRADGYDEGIKKAGPVLRADIANFTNITPTRLISEALD
jgi:uncharacterized protein (TIGR02118 family)